MYKNTKKYWLNQKYLLQFTLTSLITKKTWQRRRENKEVIAMAKKRNIIVGQSGGPTAVINSSLAGVYKNAIERGFDKV